MILPARRLRVYSEASDQFKDCDHVMVLLEYDTPEMDYFSDQATPFMHGLLDKYKNNGINLNAFYSD